MNQVMPHYYILNADNIKDPSGHFNTGYFKNLNIHISNCGTVAYNWYASKNLFISWSFKLKLLGWFKTGSSFYLFTI